MTRTPRSVGGCVANQTAVLETWDPAAVASMNEAVGYYKGSDGILHCDVTRVMNIASVSRGGDGGAAAAAVPSARRGMRKAVHERQVETLAALAKMRAELRAVDESLSMAAAPVVPTPTAIPRSRAKHPTGLVVTGLDHLNELKAAQAERLAKADKAAAKKREFWENHRKKIRAAQARLVEKKTPSKLKVSEQAALILDRTGHHTKLNSKKRDPAGDTLICAELRRVMNDPSLLPATPVADDSDASEVPEPADEGSCPCGTTPMAGAAYCHACGRQL